MDLPSILKALSDPTRLQMLALLVAKGELCVCDVMAALDITQSKSSRHLRHLVQAGFLQDRKEGVWVYFRIGENLGPIQAALFEALADPLAEQLLSQVEVRLATWFVRKRVEGVIYGQPAPGSASMAQWSRSPSRRSPRACSSTWASRFWPASSLASRSSV